MDITNEKPRAFQIRSLLVWASIFAAALLAYLPAIMGGYVWDDEGHVCAPALHSLHGLWRIWTDLGATQQYYPLLHSAFWLEYQLWGQAALGYHLTNVLLHACSACLVVLLMRRLSLPGAWLAGLVFALHPVCVESVAWVSEQKNTLSTVFALCATLAYVRFDTERRTSLYIQASLWFALALMTKSVTAMLPLGLLGLLWWKRGTLRLKQDLVWLLPWLVVGAASGLFTAWVERTYIGAQGSDFALSATQRLLLAGRIPFFYLSKLFWPADLIFVYPRWNPSPADPLQWLFPCALVALLFSAWLLRRRTRAPFAALAAYVALLFPVLGFVNVYPFIFSFVADHFQYLASLAILIPVSSALAAASAAAPHGFRYAGAAVLALLLGTLTFRQSRSFSDNEVLFRRTVEHNPTCWLALNNLGNILTDRPEQRPEAIRFFRDAIAAKPDFVEAHFNLANALGKYPESRDEAVAHYQTVLRLRPSYAEAHNNLGSLLAHDPARLDEALNEFQRALALNPAFAAAEANLATALARSPGRANEACDHYRKALRLDPDNAELEFNFANLLAKMPASRDDALAHYETALRLNPAYAEAHFNLSVLLAQIPERRADALLHCRKALEAHPEWDFARRALDRLEAAPQAGNAVP